MFDIVNDVVGPRYKAKLENRSYAEGASHEGKALEKFRRDRTAAGRVCRLGWT